MTSQSRDIRNLEPRSKQCSIFRKEGISTGKFISEKTGLYLISVSIASSTAGARYFVIQDGAPVSYSFDLNYRPWQWVYSISGCKIFLAVFNKLIE
jgi:hypothetical protein